MLVSLSAVPRSNNLESFSIANQILKSKLFQFLKCLQLLRIIEALQLSKGNLHVTKEFGLVIFGIGYDKYLMISRLLTILMNGNQLKIKKVKFLIEILPVFPLLFSDGKILFKKKSSSIKSVNIP